MSLYLCPAIMAFCLLVAGRAATPQPLKNPLQDDKCGIHMNREKCKVGYYESYASICAQCNQTEMAQGIVDTCRRNGDEICGNLDHFFSTACDHNTSNVTCTDKCREHLTTVRSTQGCCVNVFNATAQRFRDSDKMALYDHALWSRCEVEPVSEQCPPSTFQLPNKTDPTCTTTRELTSRLYSQVQCKREIAYHILSAAKVLDCPDIIEMFRDPSFCGVDQEGQYCTTGPAANLTKSAISEECPETSTCDPDCVATLNHLAATYGCCFVNQFNGTADGEPPVWMGHGFWKRCDLNSPGFCQQKFT